MRAIAILGPSASPDKVRAFQASGLLSVETTIAPGADVVLIFGGDGTVHRHLPALVAGRQPLLIVPLGSGNDFARALGLRSPEQALAAWRRFLQDRAKIREIDVGVIRNQATGHWPLATSHFFCCIGGAGLDADTNRRANAMPRCLRAHGGYVLAAIAAIARFRPQPMTVRLPDGAGGWSTPVSGPATLVAFGNAPSYGSGMQMAPRAQLDDALLDVCFVRHTAKLRLLTFFPTVFWGRHLRLPEVEYFQTDRLLLESETPADIYADGEFICKTPAEISVLARALRVIIR